MLDLLLPLLAEPTKMPNELSSIPFLHQLPPVFSPLPQESISPERRKILDWTSKPWRMESLLASLPLPPDALQSNHGPQLLWASLDLLLTHLLALLWIKLKLTIHLKHSKFMEPVELWDASWSLSFKLITESSMVVNLPLIQKVLKPLLVVSSLVFKLPVVLLSSSGQEA